MSTTQARPITAAEYLWMPDPGYPTELVRGEVIESGRPNNEHGVVCANVAVALAAHVRPRRLGRVMGNDSGFLTERDPDTVRGPDVANSSYGRMAPTCAKARRSPRRSSSRSAARTTVPAVRNARSPSAWPPASTSSACSTPPTAPPRSTRPSPPRRWSGRTDA